MSDEENALPPAELRGEADYFWVRIFYDHAPHVMIWNPDHGWIDDDGFGVASVTERVLSPEEVATLRAERDAANKDADTLAGAVRKLLRANADLEIERDELKAERERYESPAWEANERMNGVIDHLANTIEEEIRCLTLLRNELRGRLDGEAATKFFPVIDRAIDRLGESVKEYPTTMVKPQLRYVFARGETIAEQRDHVRSTPLYAMGDAKLVWVNEGDLWNLALRGVANPIDTGKPEL